MMHPPNLKHGLWRTGAYRSWQCMKHRCLNATDIGYHRYGGRGITIDPRWLRFENFLEDMGERPSGRSLDRIDNDGNYSKENCRWSTRIEQCSNTSTSRLIAFNGKTMTLAAWARTTCISASILSQRLASESWSVEAALTTPVEEKNLPKTMKQPRTTPSFSPRAALAQALEQTDFVQLSQCQRNVLAFLWNGLSAKEIGIELGITSKTVEFHSKKMKAQWGAISKIELCRLALKRGYLA